MFWLLLLSRFMLLLDHKKRSQNVETKRNEDEWSCPHRGARFNEELQEECVVYKSSLFILASVLSCCDP